MNLLNLLIAFSIAFPTIVSAKDLENVYQIHKQAAISSAVGTPWRSVNDLVIYA